MTPLGSPHRPPPPERLRLLAETVAAEAELLAITDARLFSQPMTAQRAAGLKTDNDLGERVDAFFARFGRLQDTLADKLLPARLDWLAETAGPAIDNLTRAQRLSRLQSNDDRLEMRRLRHRMIHEYLRDPRELAQAL